MSNKISGNGSSRVNDYDSGSVDDADSAGKSDGAGDAQKADGSDDGGSWLGNAADDVWESANDAADSVSDTVSDTAQSAVNGASRAVDGAANAVDDTVDSVSNAASNAVDDASQSVQNLASSATRSAQDIQKQVSQSLNTVDDAIDQTADAAVDTGNQVVDDLKAGQQQFQKEVNDIIDSAPAEEVAESASNLMDGKWSPVDEVQKAGQMLQDGVEDLGEIRNDIQKQAKDVGVDLVMAGAEQVAEQRELIEGATGMAADALDSTPAKLMAQSGIPGMEVGRRIAVNLARAGQKSPDVAQQLVDNEKQVRALAQMNQKETTAKALEQLDVGETYQTEIHGSAEVHAEVGLAANAKVSTKMTKVEPDQFQVEIGVDGNLQAGVGAGAQGQGANIDAGVAGGGKLVVNVTGDNPADARDQVATMLSAANGDLTQLDDLGSLDGVDITEAEGRMGAIASGDLTPVSVELRGDVVPEFREIGGKDYIGAGAAVSGKVGAGGPVNIQVPDGVANLAQSPDVQELDPRAQALIGEMPADVARQLGGLYGRGGGLSLSGDVKVEANLYAPADMQTAAGGVSDLAANAERMEVTFSGKVAAGNSDVSVQHQVVVKDLQGLADQAGQSADALARGLQDGDITPDELRDMVPDGQQVDQYMDFNSSAKLTHSDGISLDVAGVGGKMVESNSLTLYEVKDGQMEQKVDDLNQELTDLQNRTQFGLFSEDSTKQTVRDQQLAGALRR